MRIGILGVLVLTISLALAACGKPARHEALPPGPGDGSVKCPGNAACPIENLIGMPGIAGAEPGLAADGRPKMLICTVDPATTDAGCPAGYVGRLLLPDPALQTPTVCRNGKAPCQPRSWAMICASGTRGCPMLPKF